MGRTGVSISRYPARKCNKGGNSLIGRGAEGFPGLTSSTRQKTRAVKYQRGKKRKRTGAQPTLVPRYRPPNEKEEKKKKRKK